MIVGLVGTPSPLTYLMTNVLRAIVQVAHGDHHMLGANNLADLREAWPKREAQQPAMVLASDMPSENVIEFFGKTAIPVILCIESVDDICNYMVSCRKTDDLSALRIATQSLTLLETVATAPPPSFTIFKPTSATMAQTLARLLRVCEVEEDQKVIEEAIAYLGFANRGHLAFSDFIAESRKILFPDLDDDPLLSQDVIERIEIVGRHYDTVVSGARIADLVWPASCFLQADTPGIPIPGAIDLEGRARFLSHGPYFHLPSGLWQVEIAFQVSESFSQNRIGFDVFAGNVLTACTTTLPQAGVMACDMIFRVVDPSLPLEIRIQLLTGAIEGKLDLRDATLRRL